jgi:PAS domain S-box-containing protein
MSSPEAQDPVEPCHPPGEDRTGSAEHRPQAGPGAPAAIDEPGRIDALLRVQHRLFLNLSRASCGLDETLRSCLEAALEVSGMDCGGIYLADESGGLDLAHWSGVSVAFVESVRRFPAAAPQTRLVMAGTPVYARFPELDLHLTPVQLAEGIKGMAAIPLTSDGRILGCMNLASRGAEQVPTHSRVSLETIAFGVGLLIARAQADQALRQSEAQYRAVMETAGDGIWMLDGEGRVVAVNEAYARRSGYRREELIGMPIADLEAQESPAEVASHIETVRRLGQDRFETWHRAKDGTSWPVEVSASYWPSAGGRFIAVSRDIAERRQAEAALREGETRYRNLFAQSPDAIYVYQGDRIVLVNRACLKLFGASAPEELIGRSPLDLVHPDFRETVRERVRLVCELGESVPPLAEKFLKLDGTIVDAEVAAAPFPIDGANAAQVILRDIGERKAMEREIIEASTALQERIGRDIHDGLGQQLTGIALLAASLERRLATAGLAAEAAAAAELRLHLRATLEESRSLARGLSPMEIDLETLPGALAELALRIQETSGIPCRFRGTALTAGDGGSLASNLYRIAQEAAQNAVRHAAPIEIEIALVQAQGELVLSVRDDGRGMGPADAPRPGLGLQIMRYRAGIVGGRLSVLPAPGAGTLIRCTAPLPSPAEPPAGAAD